MRIALILIGLAIVGATPALAQDQTAPPPEIKLTGGVTLTSDYRFRGLTRTDGGPAVQSTVTLASQTGFYVGTWVSNIDGSGKTPLLRGHGDAEIDLYGGYTRTFSAIGVDAGLLYYAYPGGIKGVKTDYFEPYASLRYTIGPVSAKVGGNYAWGGQPGLDVTPRRNDNLYLYGEASLGVPRTPVTLKGHVGHTQGALGVVNPDPADDHYWDWSVNAEAAGGPVKVGMTYVDTDVTERGGHARRLGRGSTVLGYVGFSF
ncbi:TorF family putative porin [uncultured Sphingomonas sp.]|uniref:TorF family putative porin n=1 Tax=uncultured Sphingomonas sp. TaxID=158754 RepID=UPI0035CB5C19